MTAAQKAYGNALYSLAKENQLEKQFLQDLSIVQDVFDAEPQYIPLVQNPALPKAERLALLSEAFGQTVHPFVLNFCKILCEKSSLQDFNACAEEYLHCYYKANGILPVTAQSAVPLSDEQQTALRAKLAAATGKTVLLSSVVDACLLGGIKLSYQGTELDGSVKQRLSSLRAVLVNS